MSEPDTASPIPLDPEATGLHWAIQMDGEWFTFDPLEVTIYARWPGGESMLFRHGPNDNVRVSARHHRHVGHDGTLDVGATITPAISGILLKPQRRG